METTLENPVIKEDFESKLLEAADAVDHGDDFQLPSADQSEPRTPDTTEQSSPDTTPEKKDERPRDERGRFTKTPEGADIPESERTDAPVDKPDVAKIGDGKQTEVKPESEYAKAKKDAERKDRSWQALEAEKSQARAQIEAERRAIAEERQRLQQQAQPQRQQQSQYSSKDYAKFAQDCSKAATEARERGDYDEADKQADLAVKATQQAFAVSEQEQTTHYQQQAEFHAKAWEQNLVQAMQAEPEIVKVMNGGEKTPLANEVEKVLTEGAGIFERIPNGGSYAIQMAKLRLKAGAASGLEETIKKLTTENERLKGLTSINGSGPSGPVRQKSFNDLPGDEQERQLLAAASEYDNGR
jgi:hypothetical protein